MTQRISPRLAWTLPALAFLAGAAIADPTPPSAPATPPANGAVQPKPTAAAAAPAAQPPVAGEAPAEDFPAVDATAAAAAPKPRPWQRQQQPPDGKWLKDPANGREYYVRKVKRPPEGLYQRYPGNKVKIPPGITVTLDHEDQDFFYIKVFRVDNVKPALTREETAPKPEELAAKEAEYKIEAPPSDRFRFEAIGAGLPTSEQWRNGIDVADMNGDGKLDIVSSSPRRTLNSPPRIFLGDGKGGFSAWKTASFPRVPYEYGDVAVGDFDHDGHADLAIGVHLRGLIVLLGDGKGAFKMAEKGPMYVDGQIQPEKLRVFSSRSVRALDWDGNGRTDFVALAEGPMGTFTGTRGTGSRLQESYGVEMFELGGDGSWKRFTGKTSPRLFGDDIALGDFNHDGKVDFLTGSNTQDFRQLLHLHQADDTWVAVEVPELRGRAYLRVMAEGDFNLDGRDDFAVGYQSFELGVRRSGIDVMLAKAEGGWDRHTLFVEADTIGFFSMVSGDFDHDGRPDLAAGSGDGRILVFLGDGKGGFVNETSPEIDGDAGCRVFDLHAADFDRDKSPELIAAFAGEQCPKGGSIRAWKLVARK
ncbi:MAG: VCBS repeat-containing protein [Thermoanaerobaculia bacterium]